MTDVLSQKQRSYNMSKIKGKDTGPEKKLRKFLFSHQARGYRLHYALPGKPDIVFAGDKIAVFVDGCFWHKCPKCFVKPETRTDFWMKKIEGNVKRDKEVTRKLVKTGWSVLRFWEHEVRSKTEQVGKKIIEEREKRTKVRKTREPD